mmetsp:Transcript_79755/g.193266  ORF Transcript_79755/g.193266 Transcript_79755/m.193266 type:complete len:200 (+) Transcript_79755:497-1096(+)
MGSSVFDSSSSAARFFISRSFSSVSSFAATAASSAASDSSSDACVDGTVAVASAAAAAAASSAVILAVLADENVPAVEVRVVEHLDGVCRLVDCAHLHDAAALAPSSGAFGHDLRVDHLAGLAEVVLEVLPGHAPGEVVDVEAIGGDLDDFFFVVVAAAIVAAVRVVAAAAAAAAASAGAVFTTSASDIVTPSAPGPSA